MSIQAWIQAILVCLCVLCAFIMMACMLMMRKARRLTVVHKEVEGSQNTEPSVFAFLSDLHIATMSIPWGNIVDTLKENRPDFIVLTGDLCNRLEETGRVGCFLDLLTHKVGVPIYITTGNHDHEIFEKRPELLSAYVGELEALSPLVHVLDTDFVIRNGILIGGIRDVHYCEAGIDRVVTKWGEMASSQGLFFLLATHSPDLLLQLDRVPVSCRPHLTVCGHTHGGQIRTPFNLEFMLLKKDKLPKQGYFYGSHNYKGYPLYITSGLGCSWIPIRWGSNGEIVIFHLS